jgi:hypothetical protein
VYQKAKTFWHKQLLPGAIRQIKEDLQMAASTSKAEAKEALEKFKMEVATEIGVPLTNGYNGNLTSYQNGSVGGQMVKKMIEKQEQEMSGK